MIETVNPFTPTTFGSDTKPQLDERFSPPQHLFSKEDFVPVLQARASLWPGEVFTFGFDLRRCGPVSVRPTA